MLITKDSSRKFELVAIVSPLIMGILLVLGKKLFHLNLPRLTIDINATANLPFYTGCISQLGIFCWFAMAAVGFFVSAERRANVKKSDVKRFLAVSSWCFLWLGFDDAFMFHERVFPMLGISERIVMMLYAIATIVYFLSFAKVILRTRYFCLVWAILFFSISILMDILWGSAPSVEDSAKFVGIISLVCYFFLVAETEAKRDAETFVGFLPAD